MQSAWALARANRECGNQEQKRDAGQNRERGSAGRRFSELADRLRKGAEDVRRSLKAPSLSALAARVAELQIPIGVLDRFELFGRRKRYPLCKATAESMRVNAPSKRWN